MLHPNPNMLLRIAQGDAYAMAVEYVDRSKHPDLYERALKLESYLKHPTHKLAAGKYTDDTQMSIGVTELLLRWQEYGYDPAAFDTMTFAAKFFATFKRDERDGYSRGFQKLLEEAESAQDLYEKLVPDSDKNGAAMRSVPLGVIKDVEQMLQVAKIQARVTHNTPGGVGSSQAVALMSHFALYEADSFTHMFDWCCNRLPAFYRFKRPWNGPVKASNDKDNLGVGMITAHAVHTLLTTETTLVGIMQRLIEWGGDTDSVAAIAWRIASARMTEDVPEFMERDLEPDGSYGPAFLRELGQRLMKLNDG